jgi:glycosyltransferase involved in cell wall biosynthesis
MSTSPPPRVAICVPTYNRAPFLKTLLGSLLDQTFRDFNLVVVDDQSTDETREVALSFGDPRLSYVRNEKNLGMAGNYNRCIAILLEQKSPYIAMYQDDDFYFPTALEKEVSFLDRHPQAGLVYPAYYVGDENCKPVRLHRCYPTERLLSIKDRLDAICEGVNPMVHPPVLYRRDIHARAGLYDQKYLMGFDNDMHLRLMEYCPAGFIPEPLFIYRSHRAQSSALANQGLLYRENLEIYLRYAAKIAAAQGLDGALYERRLKSISAAGLARLGLIAALANADSKLLAEFEAEALEFDPSLKTRAKFLAWRLLDNSPGRALAARALNIYHALRRRLRNEPAEVANLITCAAAEVNASTVRC